MAYDLIVVGSGAAGMTAAVRAASKGLRVLVIEKAHRLGGTSATSGGVIWIPNHGLGTDDSREEALAYLDSSTESPVRPDRIEAFLDTGPRLIAFLKEIGMEPAIIPYPDYFPDAAGARADRSVAFPRYDGRRLGDLFPLVREQFTRMKLMNRYTIDFEELMTISTRSPGWVRQVGKVVGRYWLDLGTRRKGRRDRWFSLGGALMGPLIEKYVALGGDFRIGWGVKDLLVENGRVTGVLGKSFGRQEAFYARHGVIVCAGGFEWNQRLRERFLTLPGDTRFSSTPEEANRGEMLEAGLAVGAATEFTETAWWMPTMSLPLPTVSNFEEIHQASIDVGRPHSVCVNRNGDRFVDEACSYDVFGEAMMRDQLKNGANAPCWLVFDATFRTKFSVGGLMPKALMPDGKIPEAWWDHYIFRAPTLAELAEKIGLDSARLGAVVERMNGYAKTGIDLEFGRGSNLYDLSFGDPTIEPNPCLGPIDKAPFYAIPINLGDLGTKGGLKCDAAARVLDRVDKPIAGLYAAGNSAASPFGNCYPGAGGTIGPAMVFGFIAADMVVSEACNNG